jgi:hypothetical protein
MAAPSKTVLEINQKSDFQATLYVANSSGGAANLVNYTSAAKYKKDFLTPDSQALSFTSEISNASNGEITISLTQEQTANLIIQQKYVFDVTITNTVTDFKSRILEGKINVSGGVS